MVERAGITRRRMIESAAAITGAAWLGAPALASPSRRAVERGSDFDPPLGVCRGPGASDAAAAAGLRFLEIGCSRELRPDVPESDPDAGIGERLARLRRLGVPARAANGFLPGHLQATGPDAAHGPILDYASVAFERARRVGIEVVTFGSSGARSLPDGFAIAEADLQFTALLARLAERAAAHDVLLCVEPLRRQETNYINLVSHAHRLVRAVDHPNLGITADVYHMLVEGESADAIRDAGAYVRHVHVAEQEGREAPGTTGEDFTPYLRALTDIEYRGRVSIECRWQDFDRQVADAAATMRTQIGRVR